MSMRSIARRAQALLRKCAEVVDVDNGATKIVRVVIKSRDEMKVFSALCPEGEAVFRLPQEVNLQDRESITFEELRQLLPKP